MPLSEQRRAIRFCTLWSKVKLQVAISAVCDAPLGPTDPCAVLQKLGVAVGEVGRAFVAVVRTFSYRKGLINRRGRRLQNQMIGLAVRQGVSRCKFVDTPGVRSGRAQGEGRRRNLALFDQRSAAVFEADGECG